MRQVLGVQAGLDAFGQVDFLFGVQQADAADLLEVVLHRIGGGAGGDDATLRVAYLAAAAATRLRILVVVIVIADDEGAFLLADVGDVGLVVLFLVIVVVIIVVVVVIVIVRLAVDAVEIVHIINVKVLVLGIVQIGVLIELVDFVKILLGPLLGLGVLRALGGSGLLPDTARSFARLGGLLSRGLLSRGSLARGTGFFGGNGLSLVLYLFGVLSGRCALGSQTIPPRGMLTPPRIPYRRTSGKGKSSTM